MPKQKESNQMSTPNHIPKLQFERFFAYDELTAYVHALAYLYADPQRHAVGQAGQLAAQFAAPARAGTDTHCANPRCPNRAAAGQLLAAGWR